MKHNWAKLKAAYLKGKYKSLKDFAIAKNVPYRTVRKMGTNWRQLKSKIDAKGEEKTIEKASDKVAEMNARHIVQAKELVAHGRKRLPKLDYESAAGAVNAVKTGIELEREIVLPKGEDASITLVINGNITHPLLVKKATQIQKDSSEPV